MPSLPLAQGFPPAVAVELPAGSAVAAVPSGSSPASGCTQLSATPLWARVRPEIIRGIRIPHMSKPKHQHCYAINSNPGVVILGALGNVRFGHDILQRLGLIFATKQQFAPCPACLFIQRDILVVASGLHPVHCSAGVPPKALVPTRAPCSSASTPKSRGSIFLNLIMIFADGHFPIRSALCNRLPKATTCSIVHPHCCTCTANWGHAIQGIGSSPGFPHHRETAAAKVSPELWIPQWVCQRSIEDIAGGITMGSRPSFSTTL